MGEMVSCFICGCIEDNHLAHTFCILNCGLLLSIRLTTSLLEFPKVERGGKESKLYVTFRKNSAMTAVLLWRPAWFIFST